MDEATCRAGDDAAAGRAEVCRHAVGVRQGTAQPSIAKEGVAEVNKPACQIGNIHQIEAEVGTTVPTPSVERYLHALARACVEGATNPHVRGFLLALLLRAPGTIAQLGRERKRIAA